MFKKIAIATFLVAATGTAMAADCTARIEAGDNMMFNVQQITIPKSCKDFTVDFKNAGTFAKEVMGHDVVITTASAMESVDEKGLAAGLAHDYVDPNDKDVIAHTRILGGGEEEKITFPTAGLKAGGDYVFFCSFPGHSATMNGKVVVTE